MTNGKRVEFNEEGVIFHFPDKRIENSEELVVPAFTYHVERQADSEIPPDLAGKVHRSTRVNAKIFTKRWVGDPKKEVINYPTEFNPPIYIQVYYNQDDINATQRKDYRDLKLGYIVNNQFIVFTDFMLIPIPSCSWKGYGVARLSDWPDPVIAWGG
jgi:hypothetical protein